jgi:putative transposase
MKRTAETRRPHAGALRAGRWSEALACYAVTKCPQGRQPVLDNPETAGLLLSSFDYLRQTDQIRLMAFCIMPDHYHLLIFLTGAISLSALMATLGRYTARRLNQILSRSGQFWQEGFYDHRCRDEDDLEDRMTYIEHNPVRAALVERAEQWPYSSAHPSQSSLLDRDWHARVR